MSYEEKLKQSILNFKLKNPKYEKIIKEFKRIDSLSNMEFDYDIEREYLYYKNLDEILNE